MSGPMSVIVLIRFLLQTEIIFQGKVAVGDLSKFPAKRLCESSQKVFKAAQEELDAGTKQLKTVFRIRSQLVLRSRSQVMAGKNDSQSEKLLNFYVLLPYIIYVMQSGRFS
jgi:hypothetical protein